jgi:cation:H+ antiporter
MSGVLSLLLWFGLVILGVLAMYWGSSRVCTLLEMLRGRWGLPATAGGVLMGIATASPEISVNTASVAFGWPDLGLGAALGSNVPALPLVFILSYLATRFARPGNRSEPAPQAAPPPRVQPQAVDVQVIPYLLIVFLLGALTLPPAWSGLQMTDGVVLLGAYAVYFVYAVFWRKPPDQEAAPDAQCSTTKSLMGLPVIALGALASVIGARHVIDGFGFSDLVGGLFVIGLLCALPESFAAWRFAKEDKMTTAVSAAVADGIVSLTIALLPPAIVGTSVGNPVLYAINLAFIASVLVAYIVQNHRYRGQELNLRRVSLFGVGYGVYLAATAVVLVR